MVTNIYHRKDGRFEGRINLGKNAQGKYIYKSVYARDYTECVKKLDLYISLQKQSHLFQKVTYKEICRLWLNAAPETLKESTRAYYAYILGKYLIPTFGNYSLNTLNSAMINNFIDELSTKRTYRRQKLISPTTVHNIIVILKITLAFAEKELTITNPSKNIHRTKSLKRDNQLSDKDWHYIRNYLKTDFSHTASAISIAVHMGMRIGEICALKRKDIDLENKLLYVQRTVQRIKHRNGANKTKLVLGEPKSASSRRFIPIPDILLERLIYLCQNRQEDDFILGRTRKKVLDPRTLQYRFHKYLKRHNLDITNFHQLRHKFAGNCVEKKFDLKSLSEILGHSNINITLDYYVHPTLAFKRQQINMLADD